jgi:hypothetical protein
MLSPVASVLTPSVDVEQNELNDGWRLARIPAPGGAWPSYDPCVLLPGDGNGETIVVEAVKLAVGSQAAWRGSYGTWSTAWRVCWPWDPLTGGRCRT